MPRQTPRFVTPRVRDAGQRRPVARTRPDRAGRAARRSRSPPRAVRRWRRVSPCAPIQRAGGPRSAAPTVADAFRDVRRFNATGSEARAEAGGRVACCAPIQVEGRAGLPDAERRRAEPTRHPRGPRTLIGRTSFARPTRGREGRASRSSGHRSRGPPGDREAAHLDRADIVGAARTPGGWGGRHEARPRRAWTTRLRPAARPDASARQGAMRVARPQPPPYPIGSSATDSTMWLGWYAYRATLSRRVTPDSTSTVSMPAWTPPMMSVAMLSPTMIVFSECTSR